MPKSKHRKAHKKKSAQNRRKLLDQRHSQKVKQDKLRAQLQEQFAKQYEQGIKDELSRRASEKSEEITEVAQSGVETPTIVEDSEGFLDGAKVE